MKTTYRVMSSAFFDRTGIVAKLEKLALKGWQLESIGGMFWKFRRIPAQKLRYAVTYFPEVSAFDPALPEKLADLLVCDCELCFLVEEVNLRSLNSDLDCVANLSCGAR